ncbi:MAG: NADH-quinone oxidoreductase subunit L [Actinobacteria bacterium]|nr:NADH-quinone oxidoreductase subunit L [Actinomycetota bacterium]NBY16034.1 NADH-quinone oxidoreductase subunit L [Actinomycetota bacterium]
MISALIGLPLIGAALLLLGGRRTNAWGPYFAVAMSSSAFVIGVFQFFTLLGKPAEDRHLQQHLFDWIAVGNFQVPFGLHLDQLSLVFVLLITGVGSLIHIYSLGYMAHDENKRRFFGYLNLFVAAMLLLVLADNYLLLYVGWEGVGLASYLLISFYQHKPSAAVAGKKAFVVNRVGDVGLSIAIMLMFVTFKDVTFKGVAEHAHHASGHNLTLIGLALLLAACGKSAQFPLQSWLLDAMEGPTPVSALIHAATMVTAGVYLITRAHAIFDLSETARTAVVVIGAITLLLGAFIGTAKDDIKKGLAGSTMSQIGYMVLAAGLGPVGYAFAIFHLLTHGMFKAGLFLGAGSVMHGMNDDVNMRHYGALRGAMKITYVTFGLGFLAIIGIPPFAGFWSKDEIIHAAFSQNLIIGLATLLGAGVTAFYMTRMMAMTFYGEARWEKDAHPHESSLVMTAPMILLAIGSVFGGMALLFLGDIEVWLEPVVGIADPAHAISNTVLIPITLLVVLAGAGYGWLKYAKTPVPAVAPAKVSLLTRAARADAYGDALNEAIFMRPGQYLTRALVWFDTKAVDGTVGGLGAAVGGLSARLRRSQNGLARSYALTMVGGAALLALVLLLVRL